MSRRQADELTAADGAAAPLVRVANLAVSINGVPVLRRVSFDVAPGEALGLVGESGSGKSMTLRALARLAPTGARVTGQMFIDGQDVNTLTRSRLREHRRRIGMVFQDPRAAINPIRTIEDFLLEPTRDRGGDVPAERARAMDTLQRMGIRDPQRRMAQRPFELSGGLLQRVMIASALMADPDLLLADEPTTALDVTTQSDVLALTDELRRRRNTAMIFVTHDLDLATALCDRIVVTYAGSVLETAPAAVIESRSIHPYTRALLASRPPLGERLARIPVVPGTPDSAATAGPGCPFAPRCPIAIDRCTQQFPQPQEVAGSLVACHRAEEVAAATIGTVMSRHGAT